MVVVVGAGRERVFGAVSGDDEQCGHEGFLEVGEAETFRDGGDGRGEQFREFDGGFVVEFFAPVVAVHDSFLLARHGEKIFSIEAARTAGKAWVEAVEMVGRCDHENSVVVLEAVDFVEKVRTAARRDDGVNVFEDEHARRQVASFDEDVADVVSARRRFDIQRWDGGSFDFGEGVHQCYKG